MEAKNRTGKIVVIGSINMDYVLDVHRLPLPGETVLSNGLKLVCGGKGANQAYVLGGLGADTVMLGAVGHDSAGDTLLENLKNAGVDVSRIKRSECCSGMAFIPVSGDGENCIIVETGANNDVTIEYIDENIDIIKSCDIVIMQLEIPINTVYYTAMRAKSFGKTVILDPAPAVNNLPDELFANIDFIKPNETELCILTGANASTGGDVSKAAETLLQKGVKTVIVTLGANGALMRTQSGVKKFDGKKVKVVDTTAAGDTFTAAFAYMISKNCNVEDAVAAAIEASAFAVTKKGAQNTVPKSIVK